MNHQYQTSEGFQLGLLPDKRKDCVDHALLSGVDLGRTRGWLYGWFCSPFDCPADDSSGFAHAGLPWWHLFSIYAIYTIAALFNSVWRMGQYMFGVHWVNFSLGVEAYCLPHVLCFGFEVLIHNFLKLKSSYFHKSLHKFLYWRMCRQWSVVPWSMWCTNGSNHWRSDGLFVV